jgi:cell division protein FtsB
MMDKLRESRSWQLLLITTLIILVALMADVSGRMSVLYRVNQKEAQLTQQLNEARVEQDMLAAQLEYVNGDVYLEKWARGEARMSQPGDVAVIPLLDGKTRKRFTALDNIPSSGGTPSSVPEQWRRFFFEGPGTP